MSLFSRFKGDENSAESVEQPLHENFSELSDKQLFEIVEDDRRPLSAKTEAISHLSYGEALTRLVNTEQPALQREVARRIAKILDSGELTFAQLTQDNVNEDFQWIIAGYSENSEFLEQLQEGVDENKLASLAVEAQVANIRKLAASNIKDYSLLQSIAKQVKGKDKTVYRIVKEKIDVQKQTQKELQEAEEKQRLICESLEQLAQSTDTVKFEFRLMQYERNWLEVTERVNTDKFVQRFKDAQQKCRDILDELVAKEAAIESEKKAVAEAQKAFVSLIDSLQQYLVSLFDTEDVAHVEEIVQENLSEFENKWRLAEKEKQPSDHQRSSYTRYSQSILEVAGILHSFGRPLTALEDDEVKILRQILKPARDVKEEFVSEHLKSLRSRLNELQDQKRKLEEETQTIIKQINGLIRKANRVIEEGNLRQAFGIRKAINEKLEALGKVPTRMESQLEELDVSINKLQDYRNFATEPKKLELIAKMQNLADVAQSNPDDLDAENHADQIKKLQSDWKELIIGGKDSQPELWEKFHALSQAAYVPCDEFYSHRSEERQKNLKNRQELVEQMQAYLDQYNWENADWKEVEKVLRTAKQAWGSYAPVDRSANKPIQKSFDGILKSIQEIIDVEYGKNEKAKQGIVEKAEHLVESENLRDAIEQVKQLQSQWKNIGRTWQKQENKLWKAFRVHCDAVFERKDKQTQEFKAELDKNLSEALSICDKIRELANRQDASILEARSEIDELKSAFNAIHPLPKNSEKKTKETFASAVKAFEKAIREYRQHQEALTWKQVFECKTMVNDWQNKRLDKSEEDGDKQAIVDKIASIEKWPKGCKAVLLQTLDQPIIEDKRNENTESVKMLCIRLEILLDKPSPSEDQSLRMAYQVSRLQKGMSNSSQVSADQQLEEITRDWFAAEVINPDDFAQLTERFMNVRFGGG